MGEGGSPGAWGQNRALPLAAAAASEGGMAATCAAGSAGCTDTLRAIPTSSKHWRPRARTAQVPVCAARCCTGAGQAHGGYLPASGATLPVAFFPRVSASQAAAMARHRHRLRHRHEQRSQRHPQSRPHCSGRTLAAQANGPCIRRSQRQWPGWPELFPALDIRWRQGTGGGPGALELSSSGWCRRGELAGTRAGTQIALAVCSAPPSALLAS